MKKHSRVLVLILTIALAFTAFSVLSSAYSVTEYNYADVLEFYESYEYLNETFDGASSAEIFSDSTAEFSKEGSFSSESIADGEYVTEVLSRVALKFTPRAKEDGARKYDSFGINFAFAFPDTTGKIGVEIADSVNNRITVLSFDGANIQYNAGETAETAEIVFDSENPPYSMQSPLSTTLASNTYYDVVLFITYLDADKVAINMTVSGRDGSAPITHTTTVSNFDFSNIAIVANSSLTARKINFDYIEAYEGSFSHRLNDFDAVVGSYINALIAMHKQNSGLPYGDDVLKTVSKVVTDYGFTTTDATVLSSIEYCAEKLGAIYAAEYISLSKKFTEESTYTERMQLLEDGTNLYKWLGYVETRYPTIFSGRLSVSQEDLLAAKDKFNTEAAELPLIKSRMVAYIGALEGKEVYSLSFVELKALYDEISVIEICPSFYDAEYPEKNVKTVLAAGRAVIEEFERLDESAKIFVESVNILNDPYTKNFEERYLAYVNATENIFKDSSYDVYLVESGTTIVELNRLYEIYHQGMLETSQYAEEFLMKMGAALDTENFTVKVNALDEVVPYLADVERGYPGVAEAIKTYNDMRSAIIAKIEACRNFIAAAQAIDSATTIADLKTAVAAAVALEKEGSDNTVVELVNGVYVPVTYNDWKVTDAAVKLAGADSIIKALENRAQNFVDAVNAIDSAKTFAAKSAAINNALSLKKLADATLDSVKAATSKLDSAVASYNAAVTAANSFNNSVVELSMTVVASTKAEASTTDIVAIIKKFYE